MSLRSALSWCVLPAALSLVAPAPATGSETVRTWTCSRQVRALCAWQGRLFAATSGGVIECRGASPVRKWTTASGLPENDAFALIGTPGGLVAAFRRSLARWDGRAWSRLPPLPAQDAARPPEPAWWSGRIVAAAGGKIYRLDEAV